MRILVVAAMALLAAACSPVTGASGAGSPGGAPLVQSADAASCAARGGEIQRVGRLQSQQCIIKYTDAGKACTDASQCQGECRATGALDVAAGTAATGQCQANSNRFGCHARIENGKITAAICID